MTMDRPHRGSRRRRPSGGGPLLLLIGTPGTGKRPLGSYLAGERGYIHLDFENAETRERFLSGGGAALRAKLSCLRAGGQGVVITWSAGSADQVRDVKRLRAAGALPIWFDSDRGAACRAHYADVRRSPRFHFVDTFAADGSFRPVESVALELLQLRPRRRTLSGRELVAAVRPPVPRLRLGSELRFRLVAVFSALAGAAAATAVVLTGIGAATSGGHARPALAPAGNSPARQVAALPRQGVLVSNRSLAGVSLGDSMAKVKALWGGHFVRCGACKPTMWLYFYPPPADPVGAGVEFEHGNVVAVFTLGGPIGWHTQGGIKVGQILDNPTTGEARWLSCAGYSAKPTAKTGNAVTSILTQGSAVYGFALTRPSVSPCH
jgi:hypothetical protein